MYATSMSKQVLSSLDSQELERNLVEIRIVAISPSLVIALSWSRS